VSNTLLTNSYGKTYGSVTNALLYARPTGMIVAAQERHAAPFGTTYAAVRAGGGEVLAYVDPVDYVLSPGAGDAATYYSPDPGNFLWPTPTYGSRTEFSGTSLADMSVNSAWIQHTLDYIQGIIIEGKMDGVYLDVVGDRLYTALADWASWPTTEQNAFTDGNVDLVRRLAALRDSLNPSFIIVNNNVWDGNGPRGLPGENYVDGVELEHSPLNAYHIGYAGRTFAGVATRRRMLVTALSNDDAQQWKYVQGVTDVDDQSTAQYSHPNVPSIGFNNLNPSGGGGEAISSLPIPNIAVPFSGMLINPTTALPYKPSTADAASVLALPNPSTPISAVLVDPTTGVSYRT